MSKKEQSYRLLFEANPNPMWVVDRRTLRFLAVNEAAVRHYGYSREEFLSMRLQDIRPPEDIPSLMAARPSTRTGLFFAGTWRHQKKDGRVIDVEVRGHSVNFKKRPAQLITTKDVTDTIRAEWALRAQQSEFQRVLRSISDYIWSGEVDAAGLFRYRYYSPVVETVTGRPPAFYLEGPHQWLSTVHPEDRPRMHLSAERLLKGRARQIEQEYRIIRPDGKVRWVRDSVVVEKQPDRSIMLFGVVTDITRQKKAAEQLRESERAQRDFVAHISHEFRTPLTAIKGFAETLLRELGQSKHGRFLRVIDQHASRLTWLINELLELSRIESGTAKLDREPLCVKDLVLKVRDGLAELLRRRRIQCLISIDAEAKILANEPYLIQALENLLSNAIKYNRPGGWIRINGRSLDSSFQLTVSDNGKGIDPEDIGKVFERFYRGEHQRDIPTTGLGLYITKKIVELHSGRISVESQPGKGAQFTLSLPLASESRLAAQRA
ncbi:MAG: PAS domain S-box protein [Elusimicrobia bacterium]|nr:PAS domain S-box protein [Elusimicrobiota bacterium]